MIVLNEIKKFDIITIFRGLFIIYIGLYPPCLLSKKNEPLDYETKNWEKLFENSMFEKNTLNNWEVNGKAFEQGPTKDRVIQKTDGTGSVKKGLSLNLIDRPELYRQPNFSGIQDSPFANSFHPDLTVRAKGSLTSIPFQIEHDYIVFKMASGIPTYPGLMAVNLIVNDKIVRQAFPEYEKINLWNRGTRNNPIFDRYDADNYTLPLEIYIFDVKDLKNQKAQIQIYDEMDLFDGWIVAGSFAGTNQNFSGKKIDGTKPAVQKVSGKKSFIAEKKYLNIPANGASAVDVVTLKVKGKVVQEICMSATDEQNAEFWQFIDLSIWDGEKVELSLEGWGTSPNPLADISLNEEIKGIDNSFNEDLRPQFHLTPIQGWNNDVNGTVYYDGEYHLFYQYDPSRGGKIGSNMHWGHAVSRDLIHWEHLPIALGVTPLRGQNYSGSAIVDNNNDAGLQVGDEKTMIAFYTRRMKYLWEIHDFDVDSSHQAIAYSNDRGRTWTHIDEPAVKGITGKNRDPKVFWHDETKKWIMVFYIRDGFHFYSSSNLKNWEYESHVSGYHECPDFFRLNVDGNPNKKKWVLLGGSGDYAIGDFYGHQFTPDHNGTFKNVAGPVYATQSFTNSPDSEQRRINIAWFRTDWGYKKANEIPDWKDKGLPFRQAFSFPLELTLATTEDGVRVLTNPVKEITALQGEKRTYRSKNISKKNFKINDVDWELAEINCTIKLNGAKKLTMKVRGKEIPYDLETNKVSPNQRYEKILATPIDDKINLRILVDRTIMDVFYNNGQAVHMMNAKYDMDKPLFECFADGGKTKISNVKVVKLNSIWGN